MSSEKKEVKREHKSAVRTSQAESKENKMVDVASDEAGVFEIQVEMDQGWMASMIGVLETELKSRAVATLNPSDLSEIIPFRRPARDMKKADLSHEETLAAQKRIRAKLIKGLHLTTKNPIPLDEWQGAAVRWDAKQNDFMVTLMTSVEEVPWQKLRFVRQRFQQVARDEIKQDDNKQVVVADCENVVKEMLTKLSRNALCALVFRMQGFGSVVEFPAIARGGGGTNESVSVYDVRAFQFLVQLSQLMPAALVFEKGDPIRFRIRNGPLFWTIRDKWLVPILNDKNRPTTATTSSTSSSSSSSMIIGKNEWCEFKWPEEDKKWSHQADCAQEMIEREGNNHIVWVRAGLGKTHIALDYMHHLLRNGRLPRFVIWTAPDSAIYSLTKIMEKWNFPQSSVRVLIPLEKVPPAAIKSYGNRVLHGKEPLPFTITLVEHDHLRLCENELRTALSSSEDGGLLVVDEFHKAFCHSQRTAVCKKLAQLPRVEFIALSGTIVRDHKMTGEPF